MANFEVVIVQEHYDVNLDVLAHLTSEGYRLSIVRPRFYDLINRVALRGYCAIARNEATALGEGDWVIFLADRSDPDAMWFADLERDLDEAETRGAVVSVAGDAQPDATRVRDIAYRRDVLHAFGGFADDEDSEGSEDFLAELELVAAGFAIAQGTRCCQP
ncbi:MAG: glycosyltransferase family 2 protein [Actinobacteria bacterium]|nr:MAG: glycosyltransferase family 2 protein [Actinomycetota bacterium]